MQNETLFTRLSSVHRPDCALFDAGPLPAPVPDPEIMARDFGSDAAVHYAKACRPIYEDLRRVVGQISGLMILAQLTRSTEVADLSELKSCRARWQQAADLLRALRAPGGLERHLEQLEAAHEFSGFALDRFAELRPRGDNETVFDTIARHVQRAYAHLRAATSEKAGLEMVDLSQACCSCGR